MPNPKTTAHSREVTDNTRGGNQPPGIAQVELIARGELPLPERLDGRASRELLAGVHKLRRKWLKTFLARVIAMDIQRSRPPRQGGREAC